MLHGACGSAAAPRLLGLHGHVHQPCSQPPAAMPPWHISLSTAKQERLCSGWLVCCSRTHTLVSQQRVVEDGHACKQREGVAHTCTCLVPHATLLGL